MRPGELANEITAAYKSGQIYTNPNVTVIPEDRYVSVGGDVRTPMRPIYTPDLTLLGAIAAAAALTSTRTSSMSASCAARRSSSSMQHGPRGWRARIRSSIPATRSRCPAPYFSSRTAASPAEWWSGDIAYKDCCRRHGGRLLHHAARRAGAEGL